jgi:phosphoglycolate phosphatase-like HAD superfamily hydrolase
MRAVLFDIDGTLITTKGAGREAFAHAMSEALGLPLSETSAAIDRIDFRGGTDEVLLERVAAELGIALPRFHDPVVDSYLDVLQRTMTPRRVRALPGVRELVESLEQRDDLIVGLLTGNIREGARRKLEVVHLQFLVDRPGGFAEDGRERPAIADVARQRLIEGGADRDRIVVIGDTQHDVGAARAIGAAAIAVETGGTEREALDSAGADAILTDLSNLFEVVELIDQLTAPKR